MALLGFEGSQLEVLAEALTKGTFALGRLDATDRPSTAAADAFSNRASDTCSSVAALGRLARESGRRFVLVGAAAKPLPSCKLQGVTFDTVIDEAPLKIGRYIPGTDLKIFSFADSKSINTPCLFLIGAWNFRIEIEKRLRALRTDSDDLSAVYFPSLRIATLGPPREAG